MAGNAAVITAGIVSDWFLEVAPYLDGVEPADGDYVRVYGITDYTPPGVEKKNEDDSDFDSGAWASEMATGLAWAISGTVKVPRATMAADPGQEIIREAGGNVAEDGFVWVRTAKRGATTGVTGVANASFTEGGGSRTDLTKAEIALTGRGGLDTYTVPVPPVG